MRAPPVPLCGHALRPPAPSGRLRGAFVARPVPGGPPRLLLHPCFVPGDVSPPPGLVTRPVPALAVPPGRTDHGQPHIVRSLRKRDLVTPELQGSSAPAVVAANLRATTGGRPTLTVKTSHRPAFLDSGRPAASSHSRRAPGWGWDPWNSPLPSPRAKPRLRSVLAVAPPIQSTNT